MEQYQIISIAAGLVISHWVVGFIFYKIGKRAERSRSPHLYTKIADLTFSNNSLKNEVKSLDEKIKLLEKANEELFEAGRQDVIKSLRMEMEEDHEALKFIKIPQKKSLREGGSNGDGCGNAGSNDSSDRFLIYIPN